MSDTVVCTEPPSALHALCAKLTERLGPGVGVALTGIDGDPQALYEEERATIQRAIPRRQREFAAGRQAARLAMSRIGWPPAAIPSAPDRSPIWPEGLTGSISHTHRGCIAIVAPSRKGWFVGIDLEDDVPMEPHLWSLICTPGEQAFVSTQPMALQGRLVTRLFSAKEAFYKWQYPQTHCMLEFQDVHVSTTSIEFPMCLRIVSTRAAAKADIEGHCLAFNGHIVTWVIGEA